MKLQMEIRPGEGGDDARLLVQHQADIYLAFAKRHKLTVITKAAAKGWLLIELEGTRSLIQPLLNEAGGHRWQRVPPTERKGRIQTSTVTVAVFEPEEPRALVLLDSDIETFTARGSGKGGQHRNKTDSAVLMRHRPTGLEAYVDGRCQHQNRRTARSTLEARVHEHLLSASFAAHNVTRKTQIGTGMRADKIRTYREQDDTVTDHLTGRRARLRDVRDGKLLQLSQ